MFEFILWCIAFYLLYRFLRWAFKSSKGSRGRSDGGFFDGFGDGGGDGGGGGD
ncbi:hypothetical protein D3C75_343030 [compost metagenome]